MVTLLLYISNKKVTCPLKREPPKVTNLLQNRSTNLWFKIFISLYKKPLAVNMFISYNIPYLILFSITSTMLQNLALCLILYLDSDILRQKIVLGSIYWRLIHFPCYLYVLYNLQSVFFINKIFILKSLRFVTRECLF